MADHACTTRRALFGGALALSALSAGHTAATTPSLALDPWPEAISAARHFHPRLPAVLKHAQALGFRPGQIGFILCGAAEDPSWPRVSFDGDDGASTTIGPSGPWLK